MVKVVFDTDLDETTIRVDDNKVVVVPDDEVEALESYSAPVEDDTHYVATKERWFRHIETGAVWKAFNHVSETRSAPVSESFVSGPAFDTKFTTVNVNDDNLELTLADAEITSAVDNKVGKPSEFFTNVPVEHFSKSGFENAKAFNEAHADSKYRVTTKKRYADSTGHPIVQETTLELPYPKLPYVEQNVTTVPSYDAHQIFLNFDQPDVSSENLSVYTQYFNDLQYSGRLQVQAHYKLTVSGRVIEGDHTFYSTVADRQEVPDYMDNIGNIDSQEWTFSPITLQGFYGKFVVTPGVFTQ